MNIKASGSGFYGATIVEPGSIGGVIHRICGSLAVEQDAQAAFSSGLDARLLLFRRAGDIQDSHLLTGQPMPKGQRIDPLCRFHEPVRLAGQ